MTDGEAFLLVFVLIYLSDCLVWLPPSGYAIIAFWSKNHVVRRAAVQFSALKRGFAVLQPLPPFGSVFVGQTWPVSLTPEGIAPFSRDNPNPGPALGSLPDTGFLPWDSVERVRPDGTRLWINGKPFAQCATARGATLLAESVESVHRAAPESRAAGIRRIVGRNLNVNRARRRARFFRTATRSIRHSSMILFMAVFLVVPYAYWRYQDDPPFLAVLAAIWILMWHVTIQFWRLHRRFYPGLRSDRWEHAVLGLLFPQYAIRSLDALSKGFLAGSHPVAIAAALARPDDFSRLVNLARRDAFHPIPLPDALGPAQIAAESFRTQSYLPAFEALLCRIEGTINPEYHSAPAACPRCGTSYEAVGLPCEDCGGLLTVNQFDH